MFRFNRLMKPLRQLFRPNALLKSPAVMYSGGADAGGHRKDLAGEVLRSVVRLTCESSAKGGICDVYLVGAVHSTPVMEWETISKSYKEKISREREKACQEVRAVIGSLKPEVVFLGLCPSLSHDLKPHQKLKRILGSLLDDEVIAEFRVAYEEAQKYGANIVLGDRPRKITWVREDPFLVLFSFLITPNRFTDFMDFRINDDYDKRFSFGPRSKKIYVDERDQYMSATLLKAAREHSSVVAVVGRWHLPGIQKYWKQPIEVEELLSIKSSVATVVDFAVKFFIIFCVQWNVESGTFPH